MAITPHLYLRKIKQITYSFFLSILVSTCLTLLPNEALSGNNDLINVINGIIKNTKQSLQNISAQIAALEGKNELTELQKKELSLLLRQRDFTQKTLNSAQRTSEIHIQSKQAPNRLSQIEKELSNPFPKIPSVNTNKQTEKLELELQDADLELSATRKLRIELNSEAAQRAERLQLYSEKTASIIKQLDALTPKLAGTGGTDNDALQSTLKNTALAEQRLLTQQLHELSLEKRSYELGRELLRARRQLAERQVLIQEKRLNILEAAVIDLKTKAAAKAVKAAGSASEAAENAHPLIQAITNENMQIAAELTQVSVLAKQLSQEKKDAQATLDRLSIQYHDVQKRLVQIGLTDAIGLKLRNARNQLPDPSIYNASLNNHHAEVNRVQLRRIEMEDQLLELVDIERIAQKRINQANLPAGKTTQSLQTELIRLLRENKDKYINELLNAYDSYFEDNLLPAIESQRMLVGVINEYKGFIDTRILWIQSSHPIEVNDFRRAANAFTWLFNPEFLAQLRNGILKDIQSNTVIYLPFLVIAIFLTTSRRRIKKQLASYGKSALNLQRANFVDTLWASLLTFLLALLWPLLFSFFAWRIAHIDADPSRIASFSHALIGVSQVLLFILFARNIFRGNGLAERHFCWNSEHLALLRRQTSWFFPVIIPLTFILIALNEQPSRAHYDSLGRTSFILLMLAVSLLLQRLLNPDSGLPAKYLNTHSHSWVAKLTSIWYPLAILFPLALAINSGLGFVYTSIQLGSYLTQSLYLIFSLILLRALLIRWLTVTHLKLLLDKSLAEQASEEKPDSDPNHQKMTASAEQIEEESPTVQEQLDTTTQIDLSTVSEQTLKLLNSAFWLAILVILSIIWADVLPALKIFDEIVLWNSTIPGAIEAGSATTINPISLADGMSAILILIVMYFISRNIPGLLEIAILQRLPFSPSSRYAITTMVRYALIIVGVLLAFNAVDVGWSKVQWLAAAVTVGLGFGLQEIFANFFSGIIMLFERQIRVGDVITVGNISGKVSRIQMRATTITDWDRKELIIPNKEFVTSQVINWSLSDTVVRILIPIGIAYDSDTKRAYDEMLTAALENKNVLVDPEPTVRFTLFGDSTLNFELRIYIPHPDLLLETRHQLHMAINNRFQRAGIEIAYPQRDIHIRSNSTVTSIDAKTENMPTPTF